MYMPHRYNTLSGPLSLVRCGTCTLHTSTSDGSGLQAATLQTMYCDLRARYFDGRRPTGSRSTPGLTTERPHARTIKQIRDP
jgi:hypothetical protein